MYSTKYKNTLQLALVTIVGLCFTLLLIDRFAGPIQIETGYVVDREYETEIKHSMERQIQQKDLKQAEPNYILNIYNQAGEHLSISVDAKHYYTAENGQEVKYISHKGYLTGWYWSKELIYIGHEIQ